MKDLKNILQQEGSFKIRRNVFHETTFRKKVCLLAIFKMTKIGDLKNKVELKH